jgi:hypothetical protein
MQDASAFALVMHRVHVDLAHSGNLAKRWIAEIPETLDGPLIKDSTRHFPVSSPRQDCAYLQWITRAYKWSCPPSLPSWACQKCQISFKVVLVFLLIITDVHFGILLDDSQFATLMILLILFTTWRFDPSTGPGGDSARGWRQAVPWHREANGGQHWHNRLWWPDHSPSETCFACSSPQD